LLILRSRVFIVDKTSTVKGICIKVLKGKFTAKLGDCFLLSVRRRNAKRASFLKLRLQRKFAIGSIHRAFLLRSKKNFIRFPGIFVKFFDNACAIVNKRNVPISNRIYGPVLKEFCMM
jgi:large subunit ribosomal protein L14